MVLFQHHSSCLWGSTLLEVGYYLYLSLVEIFVKDQIVHEEYSVVHLVIGCIGSRVTYFTSGHPVLINKA